MSRHPILAAATLLLGLALALALAPVARATPIYAVRSVNACDTCHVEPLGWANPDKRDRLCTMDCQICHYSPTGGGLRTPSGDFYGEQILPTWGPRPGVHADPERNLPEGFPSKGRYRMFEGFSGWWAGEVPAATIEDRYGDIDPDPQLKVGGDVRTMVFVPMDEREASVFPMEGDLEAMHRLGSKQFVYASGGLQASSNDLDLTPNEHRSAAAATLDYLTLRELFVMTERHPYRAWARAGRFSPAYGWRWSDHTIWSRRDMGLDVDRQVFGVEGGINPNYPYLSASVYGQGLGAWPGEVNAPGWGTTLNFGYRDLGWHLGGSFATLSLQDGTREWMAGPQAALNLYPVTWLGEFTARHRTTGDTDAVSLVWVQDLEWLVARGVVAKARFEWMDPNIQMWQDHRNRLGMALQWHPYSHVSLEAVYRRTWVGGGTSVINDTPGLFQLDLQNLDVAGSEAYLVTHGWF